MRFAIGCRKTKALFASVAIMAAIACMCLAGCGLGAGADDDGLEVKDSSGKVVAKIVPGEDGSGVEAVIGAWESQGASGQGGSSTRITRETAGSGQGGEAMDPKATYHATADEYERFCAMSDQDQYNFYKGFKSPEDFLKWYNTAKAAYDKAHPVYKLKPGEAVDLGK